MLIILEVFEKLVVEYKLLLTTVEKSVFALPNVVRQRFKRKGG